MASARAIRRVVRWAALASAAGCGERDRLTFPSENPGDGSGPVTEITQPEVPDTSVSEGDLIMVEGRTYDPDGVDTVYIELGGAHQAFPPIQGQGEDTVSFGLQLSTIGNSGATVVLRVFGVDLLGDQGTPASRQIRIQ